MPKETKLAARIVGAIRPAKSSWLKQGFFQALFASGTACLPKTAGFF